MTPDDVKALIDDYLAAWNELDAAARQQLLAKVWTDDGHYTDPQSDGKGRDALDQIIGRLHKGIPGGHFAINSSIDHHHNAVRFAWTYTQPNGSLLNGMDFGEIADDGRLCRIIGFF